MASHNATQQIRAMRNGYHPSLPERSSTLKEQGFYHTPAWRRVRKLALQRDHYLCQLHISPLCTGVATEVHHIIALEEQPELGLELSNLQSLCWWCHEETKGRKKERIVSGVRIIRVSDGSEAEEWMNAD